MANASDLKAVNAGNVLCKYVADMYIIIRWAMPTLEWKNLATHGPKEITCHSIVQSALTWSSITATKRHKWRFHVYSLISTESNRWRCLVWQLTAICPSPTISAISLNHVHWCSALRILWAHGMAYSSLHVVYHSVCVAKLTCAASAWWGFTSAADRQHIEAVLKRGVRSRLCPISELVKCYDDKLFSNILYNQFHVLYGYVMLC